MQCDTAAIKTTCGVAIPTEELPWLKTKTNELKQTSLYELGQVYIWQTEYNGETYFIFDNCCPNCDSVLSIYTCDGEDVSTNQTISDYIYGIDKSNKDVIWTPENFSCNL
ncbi:hypothetical protein GCM10022260_00150 [Gaetbulibacter aestuarii]